MCLEDSPGGVCYHWNVPRGNLGEPYGVPNGHSKLVPRPRWSLGACRPVLGCRLLVSGSGPGSPVRKGIRERSGVSRLKRDALGTHPNVSLVTWH
ncbi:hypothetical protein CDL15_Pgr012350 [Punica granatum]|uniref:Uncharacterized protein n=1 Tax=Punica granatum TaxID=22663 RepID=A0A218X668_PUNGR|nr:hypothetical protein CDL15_Pgr012350 [Punica granatum]